MHLFWQLIKRALTMELQTNANHYEKNINNPVNTSQRSLYQISMNKTKVLPLRWVSYLLPMFFFLLTSVVTAQDISISVDDALIAENGSGDPTGSQAIITISSTSNSHSGIDVTLDFGTGNEAEVNDFTLDDGGGAFTLDPGVSTVEIPAGQFDLIVTLTSETDLIFEGDEDLVLDISAPSQGTITVPSITTTITDNEPEPTYTINNAGTANESGGSLDFVVDMSVESESDIVLDFTNSGTATEGDDFDPLTSLTITAGSTSATLTVDLIQDAAYEDDETVALSATASSGVIASSGHTDGSGTIESDDAAPTVYIREVGGAFGDPDPNPVTEGSTITFEVALSNPSEVSDITIEFGFAGGTATASEDYNATPPGDVSFTQAEMAAGTLEKTITVTTIDDDIYEGSDETFIIESASVTGTISIASDTAEGTIQDDETAPEVTVTPQETDVLESTSTMVFDVELEYASDEDISLEFGFSGGTATENDDFGGPQPTGATDLFISEYVEGSGSNKYIEIFNGTGAAVDLSDYELRLYQNGSSSVSQSMNLSGTLSNGEVIVYANGSATAYSGTVEVNSTVINHNGDDAYELYKVSSGTAVDVFGHIGEQLVWNVSGNSTQNQTLQRNSDITAGVTSSTSGFPELGTQWTELAQDDVTGLGSHSYDLVTGQIIATFSAGETNTTVTVGGIVDDNIDEIDDATGSIADQQESVILSVSGSTGTFGTVNINPGYITDNDAAPTISISSESGTESTTLTFDLTMDGATVSSEDIVLDVSSSSGGSATYDDDYEGITEIVTFPANSISTQSVTVELYDDNIDEIGAAATETFTVGATVSSGEASGVNSGTGTIIDGDDAPSFYVSDENTGTEGDDRGEFVIYLDGDSDASSEDIVFDLSLTGITAVSGSDFDATPEDNGGSDITQITIPASTNGSKNTNSETIYVGIIDDALFEPGANETYFLQADYSAGTIDAGSTSDSDTGEIEDNDAGPEVYITADQTSVTEGDDLTFTVSLEYAVDEDVTIDFSTVNGASAGEASAAGGLGNEDFESDVKITGTAMTQTVTFTAAEMAGGTLSKSAVITVTTLDDDTYEGDTGVYSETVEVTATSSNYGDISSTSTTGTIIEGDAIPTLSLSTSDDQPGEPGETTTIVANLTGNATVVPITGTLSQTPSVAVLGVDYNIPSLNFTFTTPANEFDFEAVATMEVIEDQIYEGDFTETVEFAISSISGATIGSAQTVEIIDDEDPPLLRVSDNSLDENNANMTFTVTFDNSVTDDAAYTSASPVVFNMATSDDPDEAESTGTIPGGDLDYDAETFTDVTINAGANLVNVSVAINEDDVYEDDETFTVSVTGAGTGSGNFHTDVDTPGTGTIENDEDEPYVFISDTNADETAGTMTFTVNVIPVAEYSLTMTVDDIEGDALSPEDYDGTGDLSVTVSALTSSATFDVTIEDDMIIEGSEDFYVEVVEFGATAVTNSSSQGTGTISDVDEVGEVQIAFEAAGHAGGLIADTYDEGDLVTVVAYLPSGVTSDEDITVDFAIDYDFSSPVEGADWDYSAGSITIPAGSNTASFDFTIEDDLNLEPEETVEIYIDDVQDDNNHSIGSNDTVTLTISDDTDDEAEVLFSIDETTLLEGSSPNVAVVSVSISPTTEKPLDITFDLTHITVDDSDYTVSGSDASAGNSYTLEGVTSNDNFSITAVDDDIFEPELSETMTVSMSSAAFSDTGETGTIIDGTSDETVTIEAGSQTQPEVGFVSSDIGDVNEGDPMEFQVYMTSAVSQDVTISFSLDAASSDEYLTSGDYGTIGTVTFPGVDDVSVFSTPMTLTIDAIADGLWEGNETFAIDIESVAGSATIDTGDDDSEALIQSDDAEPTYTLSVESPSSRTEADESVILTVTMSDPIGEDIDVDLGVSGDVDGSDGGLLDNTLSFTPSTTPVSAPALTTSYDINADDLYEEDEDAIVDASSTDIAYTTDGTITILNDDAAPTITVSIEGETNTVSLDEADGSSTFDISLDAVAGTDIYVTISTADGTAKFSDGDYSPDNDQEFVITEGNTSLNGVGILNYDDDIFEGGSGGTPETMTINLSAMSGTDTGGTDVNSALASASISVSIVDDEEAPEVNWDITYEDIDEDGEEQITVTVNLVNMGTSTLVTSALDVDAEITFDDNVDTDATLTDDYVVTGLTDMSGDYYISIPAGTNTASFTVQAVSDLLYEGDNEEILFGFGTVVNATAASASMTVEIIEESDPPVFTIDVLPATEGNNEDASASSVNFVVTSTPPSDEQVIVDVFFDDDVDNATYTANGIVITGGPSSAGNDDFDDATQQVTFDPGELSKDVFVTITRDNIFETDETFRAYLGVNTDPFAAVTANDDVVATITNDDSQPTVTISIDNSALSETTGVGSVNDARIVATLSEVSTEDIDVEFGFGSNTTASHADLGGSYNDFEYDALVWTIPSGSISATMTIDTFTSDDDIDEGDGDVVEIEIVSLTNSTEDGDQDTSAFIEDDEAAPIVTLNAASNDEGNDIEFEVNLDRRSDADITVTLSVDADGSAEASDFTVTSTSVTIVALSTTTDYAVATVQDRIDESATDDFANGEDFSVNIDNVSGGVSGLIQLDGVDMVSITSDAATGTIIDDDTAPEVIVVDASVTEGTGDLMFYVAIDQTVAEPVATSSEGAIDYDLDTQSNGLGDPYEANTGMAPYDEDFDPAALVISGTIPAYATSQSQTVMAADLFGTLTTPDDDLDELDETFEVYIDNLTAEIGAIVSTAGTMTILDNDDSPIVVFLDGKADDDQGDEGTMIALDFGLERPRSQDTDVTLVFSDGTAVGGDGAVAGEDDYDNATQVVTVSAYATTGTYFLDTTGNFDDTIYEGPSEDLTVSLGTGSGENDDINIGSSTTGTIVIYDNDTEPLITLFVTDFELEEGENLTDGESTEVFFRLTTDGVNPTSSGVTTTVDFSINDGLSGVGIADDSDYTVTYLDTTEPPLSFTDNGDETWTIEIAPGAERATVSLNAINEASQLDEIDETIFLEITEVTEAAESGDQDETVTIIDEDVPSAASISIESPLTEGSGSGTTGLITVSLDKLSDKDITVGLQVSSLSGYGIADETDDYVLDYTTVSIPAGSMSGTSTITTVGDLYDEPNEEANVVFDQANTVNPGTGFYTHDVDITSGAVTGTTTIEDDDAAPTIELVNLGPSSIDEEDGGTFTYVAHIVSGATSKRTIDITVALGDGTATTASNEVLPGNPGDHTDISTTTVTIEPDSFTSSTSITIDVLDDDLYEGDDSTDTDANEEETVIVEITGYNTDSIDGEVTAQDGAQVSVVNEITDDNTASGESKPIVEFVNPSPTILENGGSTTITATITPNGSQSDITIDYTEVPGDEMLDLNAMRDTDYSSTGEGTSGLLSIPAGTFTTSITFTAIQDPIKEMDETVTFQIDGIINAEMNTGDPTEYQIEILDDESEPLITLSSDVEEVFEDGGTGTLTVTLSEPSGLDVEVTIGASAVSIADEDDDFLIGGAASPSGNTVVIPGEEGITTATFSFETLSDLLNDEDDEAAVIEIISAVNASITNTSQISINIIEDNDPPYGFQVDFVDPSGADLDFVNSLNQSALRFQIAGGEEDATFTYEITDGTSTVSGDGVITDPAIQTINDVDVTSLNDGELELEVILTDQNGNSSTRFEDDYDPSTGLGTKSTDTITKTVGSDEKFYEGISPNGDGMNDTWQIVGIEEFPDNKIVIFNRWGVKVWEASGYNNTDVAFAGVSNASSIASSAALPAGSYFYVLTYPAQDGSEIVKKGFIVITR